MFLDTTLRRLCTSSLVLVEIITTMELKNGTNCPFVVHEEFVRDYDAVNLFYFSRWVMMFHYLLTPFCINYLSCLYLRNFFVSLVSLDSGTRCPCFSFRLSCS